ncbi:MAG: rhomboid family intramembrane serine protease [Legionellaceae bacterium]|nr:rhomboid family intramembrane serine protease [Legionellaceae bacterium]
MLEEISISLGIIVEQTKLNFPYLLKIFMVMWGVFYINLFLGKKLLYLGIIPRSLFGIPGIVCAPFLHADFNHLFFNTIPLIVLSNFILIDGVEYFIQVSIYITLLSGIMTWLFAKPGIHVGASSVITGYWALLVSNIYQQATIVSIILGVICIYYFAGIFLSIFPGKKGVSWEGHLFGLFSGAIVAYYF